MPAHARTTLRAVVLAAALLAPLPAAAAPCTNAAAKADPVGTTKCPGVAPGTGYLSGNEACTFAFVFTGSDRRRYVATAGHCAFVSDADATQTWRPGTGPVVTDKDGRRLGTFAYATMQGQFRDFALVRLDPGVAADPAMCHFGGPTGVNTAISNADIQVHHYGQGIGYLPARTGDMFFGLYRPDYVYFYGAASVGDSGGPVIAADGSAVGVLTDLTTPFTGNVGVNRLQQHVVDAQKALRIRLTLATAPLR